MPGFPDIYDDVSDSGGGGSMTGGNFWEGLGDLAGKAFDFLGEDDNQWLQKTIVRLIAENPELDYEQIIDLAIQQTRMNAPNVYTPQGTSTTTFGDDGQPTITQTYTPEIQALYEMLVGNAGAAPDTYHAPRNFDPMMGKYINDREQHMGLPQTEYEPWRGTPRGAVNFPEIVPNLPPGTTTKTTNSGPINTVLDYPDTVLDSELNSFFEHTIRNNSDWQSPDFSWDRALENYGVPGALEGIDPSKLDQLIVEQGDKLAGAIGAASGLPLGGTIGKWLGGLAQDNYWKDTQWQSPAGGGFNKIGEPTVGIPKSEIQEYLDAGDPSTWGAQQNSAINFGRAPIRGGTAYFRSGGQRTKPQKR